MTERYLDRQVSRDQIEVERDDRLQLIRRSGDAAYARKVFARGITRLAFSDARSVRRCCR